MPAHESLPLQPDEPEGGFAAGSRVVETLYQLRDRLSNSSTAWQQQYPRRVTQYGEVYGYTRLTVYHAALSPADSHDVRGVHQLYLLPVSVTNEVNTEAARHFRLTLTHDNAALLEEATVYEAGQDISGTQSFASLDRELELHHLQAELESLGRGFDVEG